MDGVKPGSYAWKCNHLPLQQQWKTFVTARIQHHAFKQLTIVSVKPIDDYAKMADKERSDIYVVLTKSLCGRNFVFGKLQS